MPYLPNLRGMDTGSSMFRLIADALSTRKNIEPGMGLEGGRGPYKGGAEPGISFDNLKPQVQQRLLAAGYKPGSKVSIEDVAYAKLQHLMNKEYKDPFSGPLPPEFDWGGFEKAIKTELAKPLPEETMTKLRESVPGDPGFYAQPYPGGLLAKYKAESPGSTRPFNIEETVARHRAEVSPAPETIRAYHGTTEGPVGTPIHPYEAKLREEFERETGQPLRTTASAVPKFQEPGEHRTERGIFFTSDPDTAARYAGGLSTGHIQSGSKVFPVDINAKNSVTVDLEKIAGKPLSYDPDIVKTSIDHARQNNKDFVIIKNMWDIGGKHDQIIAVRPSGKVKSAITGEALYGLAGLMGAYGLSPRQRADESTIAPSMVGR